MEPTRSSGGGSGNSGTYSPGTAESLRFEEEIHSLMLHPTFDPPPVSGGGGSSFTALLGLPPTQAVELLHDPPPRPAISAGFRFGDHHEALALPLGCTPTFPSNAVLIDRAARFSVFAAEESPEASNSGDVKAEPADSGDRAHPPEKNQKVTGNKRKDAEKSKVKGTAKKSKSAEENAGGGEKLPYVHVRARRGQATDSHSLAERARREKINARMKLLQELVPGCSKISGTALVLDEIINHVQSLQQQVELLSMRLAAVNPRIDFSGLDNILSTECGRLTAAGNGAGAIQQSAAWLDCMINKQQQLWLVDLQQPQQQQQQLWERDGVQDSHMFVGNPAASSIYAYDSSNPSSGLHIGIFGEYSPTHPAKMQVSLANQLKTELVSLPNQLKTEL